MQTKKPPEMRSIENLPAFVQECVSKIWKENGSPKNMKDVMYTYFDAIYTARPMPQDLWVHECVHYVRQGGGEDENLAKEWWERYVADPNFRLTEEVMAYQAQYQFMKRKTNKAVAFEHAKKLAKDLSGPMYGNLISFYSAVNAIIKE